MGKRVYISADYALNDGDRSVVDELHKWGNDNLHKVDYYDTAQVASGSVSKNIDCRPCDLKSEFNRQITLLEKIKSAKCSRCIHQNDGHPSPVQQHIIRQRFSGTVELSHTV